MVGKGVGDGTGEGELLGVSDGAADGATVGLTVVGAGVGGRVSVGGGNTYVNVLLAVQSASFPIAVKATVILIRSQILIPADVTVTEPMGAMGPSKRPVMSPGAGGLGVAVAEVTSIGTVPVLITV
jgi:hypothetical protein